MRIRNIKLRYKILMATAALALVAGWGCFEVINVFGGGTIREIKIRGSTKISILSDGFQDRRSYVYLNSSIWLPKLLFGFDPYSGDSYSFDVSKDEDIVRFQQGSNTQYIHLQDSTVTTSGPTEANYFRPLLPQMTNREVDGARLWGFQSLFYQQ